MPVLAGPITGHKRQTAAAKRPPQVRAPGARGPSRSAAGGHHAYMVDLGGTWVNPWPGNELDYSQMVIAPSMDEVGGLISGCFPEAKPPRPRVPVGVPWFRARRLLWLGCVAPGPACHPPAAWSWARWHARREQRYAHGRLDAGIAWRCARPGYGRRSRISTWFGLTLIMPRRSTEALCRLR